MTNVYVVTSGDYDYMEIDGIFATESLAQEYIDIELQKVWDSILPLAEDSYWKQWEESYPHYEGIDRKWIKEIATRSLKDHKKIVKAGKAKWEEEHNSYRIQAYEILTNNG